MKHLTILACILTSIMLTACVGAVNIGGGSPTDAPFCSIKSNADNPRCTDILSRATAITWLQGFASPLPNTASQANNSTSFLRVNEDGTINTSGVNVNFADGRARTLTRDGDSQDGVIFYKGTPDGGATAQFFAGILPTTDLGLPVPQTEPDATWTGSYRRAGTGIVNNVSFDIDFDDRTIDAKADFAESSDIDNLNLLKRSADEQGISNARFLIFDLDFTPNGVISGTVSFDYTRTVDSADATGLIGQDGLVGVFVDSTTGARGLQNFYGGFWAEPDSE